MMRLSIKNKIFIIVFTLIIAAIIAILVYSAQMVKDKTKNIYDISNSVVLFKDDTSKIDTSKGGKIEEKWNGEYYYLSEKDSYLLGEHPVVYDSKTDKLNLLGTNYQVKNDGSVVKVNDMVTIEDASSYFYKLEDRVYLIVANEIYTSDRTIYAKKYLIVYLDKQGNASLLSDSINVKTINPITLQFGEYSFDVANEKLVVKDLSIDLKTIIGSTNEYVYQEPPETEYEYDKKEMVDAYNELLNDFSKYAKNHDLITSANNQVTNNNIVINNGASTGSGVASDDSENKTELFKKVSLRGAVSYQSYIDVSYIVTDPESKYQAVYLLVTGDFSGTTKTEKIVLDKYDVKRRVNDLTPNSEYSISLGYIEVVYNEDSNENTLVDDIEDVINVRTSKIKYTLNIEKISMGKVFFSFRMPSSYAFETCDISLYVDGEKSKNVAVTYTSIISDNGFSSSFVLGNGALYELRIENAVYGGKTIEIDIRKKFTLATLNTAPLTSPTPTPKPTTTDNP